jgi:hypothetical protein
MSLAGSDAVPLRRGVEDAQFQPVAGDTDLQDEAFTQVISFFSYFDH